MRILVVEDDPTSRMVLSDFLAKVGEVSIAADGEEALKAVEEAFLEGRRFDLICLDIMMPRFDGQMVLKAIRELEATNGIDEAMQSKIIMTTALDDKQNFVEALPRCDAYLTKPIDFSSLMFYISKFGFLPGASDPGRTKGSKDDKRVWGQKDRDLPWVD
ncbi:MAG TPA: response regulator [Bacteroidota bacterium]|nr:response regulator [Bacteroidota bacterium]